MNHRPWAKSHEPPQQKYQMIWSNWKKCRKTTRIIFRGIICSTSHHQTWLWRKLLASNIIVIHKWDNIEIIDGCLMYFAGTVCTVYRVCICIMHEIKYNLVNFFLSLVMFRLRAYVGNCAPTKTEIEKLFCSFFRVFLSSLFFRLKRTNACILHTCSAIAS